MHDSRGLLVTAAAAAALAAMLLWFVDDDVREGFEEWDLPIDVVTQVPDVGEAVRYEDEDGDVNGAALPSKTQQQAGGDVVQAASAGRVIASLPVAHLARPDGGNWGIRALRLKKSTLLKSVGGRPAIRVLYPAGSGTSKHNKSAGGMDLDAVPKGLPSTAAKLAFDVMFPKGFAFATGGKLGGFMIGVGNAAGGKFSADGASHRVVFRPDGGVSSYVYLPTAAKQTDPALQKRKFGTIVNEYPANRLVADGKTWNRVVVGVRLNSVKNGKPVADGKAFLTVNGGTPKEYGGIVWRRRADMTISRITMSTFFGGPDPSPKNNKAIFSNFQLRTYD